MRKDLLHELVCDHCGRDYGVYAIGLFCPDCGAPNVRLHFAREADLVGQQVALAQAQGEVAQEPAYRLLGNAHEDVLTAFEATLKAVYHYGVAQPGADARPVKPVKNDFQNVARARERFAELGLDPFDGLDAAGLATLSLNIQKRHVIGHNLGVADANFVEHADDARVGETIQIVGEDIRQFAAIGQQVIDRLDAWLGGSPSPTMGADPSAQLTHSSAQAPSRAQEERMMPGLDLSPLAQRLGCWLAERSQDGLLSPMEEEPLLTAFADVRPNDLEEAIAELECDGYVTTSSVMGTTLPIVHSTLEIFAAFDPVTIGTDPTTDACNLAAMALETRDGDDSVDVRALHERTGWSLRRFNSALWDALLLLKIVYHGEMIYDHAGNY